MQLESSTIGDVIPFPSAYSKCIDPLKIEKERVDQTVTEFFSQ